MPIATVNRIDIHYEVAGEGPPLLLIAGLGQHAGAWAPVLPQLQARFRCIAFDNRGTGRSQVPPGPYAIDGMADDAAALLGHLGLARVHALGWSLGGSVLQSLLIRHGRLLDRAVLLNAFPSYTRLQHDWLDALIALRRAGLDRRALASFALPWGLTGRWLADHDRAIAIAEAAAADPWPTGDAGFEGQAAGLRIYESRPGLPQVATPTLVLSGAEDILTPIAQSAEIAALIPDARLQVLGRGGHRMVVEYPDDTLAAVTAFLGGS